VPIVRHDFIAHPIVKETLRLWHDARHAQV